MLTLHVSLPLQLLKAGIGVTLAQGLFAATRQLMVPHGVQQEEADALHIQALSGTYKTPVLYANKCQGHGGSAAVERKWKWNCLVQCD